MRQTRPETWIMGIPYYTVNGKDYVRGFHPMTWFGIFANSMPLAATAAFLSVFIAESWALVAAVVLITLLVTWAGALSIGTWRMRRQKRNQDSP